ncbi:MAG: protein tyrosine phosphatase [Legionellaceae bacterium]|nr:protein tyrosine phosphatase [Legionellaceae bacterium]
MPRFAALLCLASLLLGMQAGYARMIPLRLGETRLHLEFHAGHAPILVHLHQNETTAYTAILRVAAEQGNAWLSLRHAGGRNVRFRLKGKTYIFDPNRMFTAKGIEDSLRRYSQFDRQAAREVARLAAAIQDVIGAQKVVAVHNNQGYSLRDYLPGHPLAGEATALHVAQHTQYRNFFLVTRTQDFSALQQQGYNVVAQAAQAEDDGSLSVSLAERPYINVEAGFDQLTAQRQMLRDATCLLG